MAAEPAADRPHVVVLVPTYNEAENIEPMLDALGGVAGRTPEYRFTFLVVDDQSPDGTGRKVEEYARRHPEVELISRPRQGLGVAMVTGYRGARELGADVVVSLDCDFQWDPEDISRLLATLGPDCDVVIGSRHTRGGRVEDWPIGRTFTHWVANTLFATHVAGTREVLDHNGNFRAIRVAGVLDRLRLDDVRARGYGFFNLMIYELSKIGARFVEIPVTFRWRQHGETKVSFSPKYMRTFVRDTFEYIRLCCWIRWDRSVRRSSKNRN